MIDRAGMSRVSPGLPPDPFARLAERLEADYPDDYAVLAWRPGVTRDADALRRALDRLTPILADHCEVDGRASLSRLQGEFLYAVHARELARRLDALLGHSTKVLE